MSDKLDEGGSKSLPLVLLVGAALGVAMSLQMRDNVIRFRAKSLLLPSWLFPSSRRAVITALGNGLNKTNERRNSSWQVQEHRSLLNLCDTTSVEVAVDMLRADGFEPEIPLRSSPENQGTKDCPSESRPETGNIMLSVHSDSSDWTKKVTKRSPASACFVQVINLSD